MKLSLSWIFDHIKTPLKEVDIPNLLERFSQTTAEIEDVRKVTLNLDQLFLVKIKEISPNQIKAECPELKKNITLPNRADAAASNVFLVKKEEDKFQWAVMGDLGSTGSASQSILPQFYFDENWKKNCEPQDYIIEVDNKALTHRPDMWCHRGFAREMAALLKKDLIQEDELLATQSIKHYANVANFTDSNLFSLEIESVKGCENPCKRLAGYNIQQIENRASIFQYAHRLTKIDARPINTLIDFTNYVMFDIGQPMHAFDADKIPSKKIVARCGVSDQELILLDGDKIKIEPTDCVITSGQSGQEVLALAGIMGGSSTALSDSTKSLLIESANFHASTIRKTAARIKKRTEASARFEKSLDPNQNTNALLRFIKLLEYNSIKYEGGDFIISIGELVKENVIKITQEVITSKIGMNINPDTIIGILSRLGFGVQVVYDNNIIRYTITVPTFRSSKDVTIEEDIIEEIARFIGLSNIPQVLPTRLMNPIDLGFVQRMRAIKNHMAFSISMKEAQTYAFYDEPFLKDIKWQPQDSLKLKNPFSQHIQQLVTSLIPNLLRCIEQNKAKQDSINFFEFNRVWFFKEKIVERKELAGIFYEHKKEVDFYQIKNLINSLFDMIGISITWRKPTRYLEPWYNMHQTAEIVYNDRVMGLVGLMSKSFLKNIADGSAAIFEIDGDFILNVEPEKITFKNLLKYQDVHLDISMFVPITLTIAKLESLILSFDKKIQTVALVDFYENPEWADKKSVTMRYVIYDDTKTLAKEDIDSIENKVEDGMKSVGAQIR